MFVFSLRLFGGDRLAEIFDSSRTVSSALSGQVRSELSGWRELMRLYASDTDPVRGAPGAFSRELVRRSEVLHVAWMTGTGSGGAPFWSEYRKESWASLNSEPLQERFADLIHAASSGEFALRIVDLAADDRFACHAIARCKPVALAALALGDSRATARHFVVSVLEPLLRIFGEAPVLKAYLVGPQGLSVLSSDPFAEGAAVDFSGWSFFAKLKGPAGDREGAEEAQAEGKTPVLVSYSSVGLGGMSVVSLASRSAALRALRVPLWKLGFGCVALLSLAALILIAGTRRASA